MKLSPNVCTAGTPEACSFDMQSVEPAALDLAGPAFYALQAYGERVHDSSSRVVSHPMRTFAILRDFADEYIDASAYSAALLHDIGQRINKEEGRNARAALKQFSQDKNVSPRDWKYTAALLADLDIVEDYSETARREPKSENHELAKALETKDSFYKIPTWMWNHSSGVTDPAKMLELLERVNIESVLIKSAEMLDNLTYPAPKETSVLQDIFDTESFYAPLCEIMGFDGMAMALRSTAAQIRLRRAGNIGVLQSAQEMLEPLKDRALFSRAMNGMLNDIFGNSIVEHAIENESQHEIMIAESVLQDPVTGELLRAVSRVKSLGSTAVKLAAGRPVPDLVGTIIITQDEEQAIAVYQHIASATLDGVEEGTMAPSDETEPFDIRGGESFVAEMSAAVSEVEVAGDMISVTETTNGYQVAKRTMKYLVQNGADELSMPVEIQVQTEDDRLLSRIGRPSHIAYKMKQAGSEGSQDTFDIDVLARIRDRKLSMKGRERGQLIEPSEPGGEKLQRVIARARSFSRR